MTIPRLPLTLDLETKQILKQLSQSNKALAELKGVSTSIPNQEVLFNTLFLQEAKDSSAIENIITTNDEIYRSDLNTKQFTTLAAKEVYAYAAALRHGFLTVRKTGLLTINHVLEIQSTIEENTAGIRKLPGTTLKNESTGEIIYTPPQNSMEINDLLSNLERFINEDDICDWDPLIKMAIIHHQFESIHPFYDGNGRTGRIINILYLVQKNLLDSPVLYLSRYINQNKSEYYRLLQEVRDIQIWEEWVLFLLKGVEQTAKQTISLIQGIKELIYRSKHKLRDELPKIYSQDFLNIIFAHPYTKIDWVAKELKTTRLTATKYLDETSRIGLLKKTKIGRGNYYINQELLHLLSQANQYL